MKIPDVYDICDTAEMQFAISRMKLRATVLTPGILSSVHIYHIYIHIQRILPSIIPAGSDETPRISRNYQKVVVMLDDLSVLKFAV